VAASLLPRQAAQVTKLKYAVGAFVNVDLTAFERLNSCIARKLSMNYILRKNLPLTKKSRKVTEESSRVKVKSKNVYLSRVTK